MQSKELPMLYSTDMVVGILEDRKKKTRRVKGLELQNEHPDEWDLFQAPHWFCYPGYKGNKEIDITEFGADFQHKEYKSVNFMRCPYAPGDILWVRETWGLPLGEFTFKAGFDVDNPHGIEPRWKPSIHMKKIHARIWLRITDIKVERLQNITDRDAISEGITSKTEQKKSGRCIFYKDYCNRNDWYWSPKASFMSLWQKINGRESWRSNPWVWVISFRVLSKTGEPQDISGFKTQPYETGSLKSSPSGTVNRQVKEAHLLPGNGEGKEVANG